MEELRAWAESPRFRLVLVGAAVCGAAVLGLLFLVLHVSEVDLLALAEGVRAEVTEWLAAVPAGLFLLLFAILPLFGMPVSFFWLLAVPVVGGPYALPAILGSWTSLAVCMGLAHVLSGGIGRPLISQILLNRGVTVPAIRDQNQWKAILAIRLSPLPFSVQNYTLGLAGCRFLPYMVISWPIHAAFGLGLMLIGESFASGGLRYALIGAFLLICAAFFTQAMRRRLRLRVPRLQT